MISEAPFVRIWNEFLDYLLRPPLGDVDGIPGYSPRVPIGIEKEFLIHHFGFRRNSLIIF